MYGIIVIVYVLGCIWRYHSSCMSSVKVGPGRWEPWNGHWCSSISVIRHSETFCSNMLVPNRCQEWTDQGGKKTPCHKLKPWIFTQGLPTWCRNERVLCAEFGSPPWQNSNTYNRLKSEEKHWSVCPKSVCRASGDSQGKDKWVRPRIP